VDGEGGGDMNFEESEDKMMIEFLKGKIKRLETEIEKMKMSTVSKETPWVANEEKICGDLTKGKLNEFTFKRPEKVYFSTREVVAFIGDYTGMVVSAGTIHKYSMLGKIPFKKAPNGRLLFPVKEVKEWIDGGGSIESCQ
jgi:hypothetical protein